MEEKIKELMQQIVKILKNFENLRQSELARRHKGNRHTELVFHVATMKHGSRYERGIILAELTNI